MPIDECFSSALNSTTSELLMLSFISSNQSTVHVWYHIIPESVTLSLAPVWVTLPQANASTSILAGNCPDSSDCLSHELQIPDSGLEECCDIFSSSPLSFSESLEPVANSTDSRSSLELTHFSFVNFIELYRTLVLGMLTFTYLSACNRGDHSFRLVRSACNTLEKAVEAGDFPSTRFVFL